MATPIKLTLASLMEDLDGGLASAMFDAELRRAVMDCMDRPVDDKERQVNLTLKLVPIPDPQGNLEEVKGKFFATSSIPKRRSREYSFAARIDPTRKDKAPMLVFNDLSLDDVNQMTLDGMDG